jgi:SAM-dependent methyltransferase
VERDTRAARAASFGSVADVYERARPGYPDAAVHWLVGERAADVVDLGAGTGKLTRQLAAAGHRVVAVDPSAEMLAELRRAVPGVTAHVAPAEEIPRADGSADVVTVAQAFHWFDPSVALPQIARVLRPRGVLALVWNVRDESEPWVERLTGLIGSERVTGEELGAAVAASGLFGPLEARSFAHAHVLDREGLRSLVASRSHCATRMPHEREQVLTAVERLYDESAGPEGLMLPYVTEAFRARRL